MNDYRAKTNEFWQTRLTADVYDICRQKGTEPAGTGKYNKFFDHGIYFCICCGGDFPLFKSETKFDAKSGWPSFWDVASADSVTLHQDNGWLYDRTEVKCARCNAHLGHVFDDGPNEHTGMRYCINSACLTFVHEN
jgi:peptide-methionine (R)-S-oxide reductase